MRGGDNLVERHARGLLGLREVRPRGHVSCEPRGGSIEEPIAKCDVLVFYCLGEGNKETCDPRRVWVLVFGNVGGFPNQARECVAAQSQTGLDPRAFGGGIFPEALCEILKLGWVGP